MGSLALWGALGGAGKGAVENADAERKVESAQMEGNRQMKLAQFEAEQASTRQQAGFTEENKSQAQALAAQKENIGTEQAGATGRTQLEINERQAANKYRSDTLKSIGAGHDAARRDAAGAAKEAKNGWSQKVLKVAGFDPQSHLPTTNDTVALTHPAYGTFIQAGDKFLQQGTDPKAVRRAPIPAVNDLLSDPNKADDFISAYHYLPAPFFKVLAGKGQLGAASSNGNDSNAASVNEDASERADDNIAAVEPTPQ